MTHFQKYSADAGYIYISVSDFSFITSLMPRTSFLSDCMAFGSRRPGWRPWLQQSPDTCFGLVVLCVMTIATSALTSNHELSC